MRKIIKLDVIVGSTFFPVYLMESVLTLGLKKELGFSLSETFNIITGNDRSVFFVYPEEWQKICNRATAKLLGDKKFGGKIEKEIRRYSSEVKNFSNSIKEKDISKKSNQELFRLLERFILLTEKLRVPGWIPNLVNLSDKNILEIAKENLAKYVPAENLNSIFATLTFPLEKIDFQKAEIELLKIAESLAKKNRNTEERKKAYLQKYAYLTYYYKGPALTLRELNQDLKEKIRLTLDIQAKIKELENQSKIAKKQQLAILKKYKIKGEDLRLIKEIQRMTFLKAYRKEIMTYSNFKIRILMEEIGRRLGLNFEQVRTLMPNEIQSYLKNPKLIKKNEVNKRIKEFTYTCRRGKVFPLTDKKLINSLKKIAQTEETEKITSLLGQCAYPGKARGVVKIIEKREEMAKMKKGDVLVSRSTNPEIITAMEKASAIITDVGGITCHAAIVARELKIPCVIGTKFATKTLKDGARVEVDAEKGIVFLK